MLDIAAPQIFRTFDTQLPSGRGADERLGWQQVEIATAMLMRVVTAAELEPEYLRQPASQRAVGFNFVLRRISVHRMSDHQFLAVCRGHASPFNRR